MVVNCPSLQYWYVNANARSLVSPQIARRRETAAGQPDRTARAGEEQRQVRTAGAQAEPRARRRESTYEHKSERLPSRELLWLSFWSHGCSADSACSSLRTRDTTSGTASTLIPAPLCTFTHTFPILSTCTSMYTLRILYSYDLCTRSSNFVKRATPNYCTHTSKPFARMANIDL